MYLRVSSDMQERERERMNDNERIQSMVERTQRMGVDDEAMNSPRNFSPAAAPFRDPEQTLMGPILAT